MNFVRPFVKEDIPQVADLHYRVHGARERASSGRMESYRRYFADVFLPAAGDPSPLSSLVCERSGRILGFLGVMPRRMLFKGNPLLAAVCSQFMVDPAERGQAGLQMLKRCFTGPQVLSITDEAGDNTRKIWEWCGGATVLPYSIHWIRPLRPTQVALSMIGRRRSLAAFKRASAPVARMVDAVVTRFAGPFRLAQPRGSREELDEATLLACVPDFSAGRAVAPDYDARLIAWLVERARHNSTQLRKLLVRDEAQRVSGWFVYCVDRGGIGEVLQIGAKPNAVRDVLDHLLHDAWLQGAAGLSGRLEPAFVPELSERSCLLYRRGCWTLTHSKQPEVLHALQRGDAFFSRLEGEWCLRFP